MGKYNQCPELDSVVRTITVTLSWEPLLSIVMEAHRCHCRCGWEQMMRECLLIVQLHEEIDPFASSVYIPRKQSC